MDVVVSHLVEHSWDEGVFDENAADVVVGDEFAGRMEGVMAVEVVPRFE